MLAHLKSATNVAYTANGAKTLATTESKLVDFFAIGSAMRNRTDNDKIQLFAKAFHEDRLLALKLLFHTRDIRGGQGERDTFRTILKYMAIRHPEHIEPNVALIPFYGRWDDILVLLDTPLQDLAMAIVQAQLSDDLQSDSPSLLAKWLPSENASSYKTKLVAKKVRELLSMTSKQYRKTLSSLRTKINIVESKMSANEWSEIQYDKLPSKAGMIYRNAFYNRDSERYTAFIESLKRGETKVNANTLYPYEIVREYMNSGMVRMGNRYYTSFTTSGTDEVLEAMWKNLPDYVGDNFENALAVVDTSGSMSGLPIQVALSLGLYLAERNKGTFHNHFITFSSQPELQEIIGSSLGEKLNNMASAHWDMSTNIESVFRLILDTAIANRLPQSELPTKLFIVSDMQFDCVRGGTNARLFETMKNLFASNGYQLPELVFWNVNAFNTNFPVKVNETGTALVSGCSPSIFKNLLAGKDMTPYMLMLDVLNSERYDLVI